MKAVDSRVIVKVKKDALKTKIGSFEFQEGSDDYEKAEVIAVGSKAVDVVAGDNVLIYKGAGKLFKDESGEEYKTVALNEIIVVL